MVGLLLLNEEELYFVAAYKAKLPNGGVGMLDMLGEGHGAHARSMGDSGFSEVVDLPPAEQVKKVRRAVALLFADGPKLKIPWLTANPKAKLKNVSTLSFKLPTNEEKTTVKQWLAETSR